MPPQLKDTALSAHLKCITSGMGHKFVHVHKSTCIANDNQLTLRLRTAW